MGFYERACRSLAERKSVEVSEVVAETDVSGGTSVANRALDGLIKKVEVGKLAGIIVPDSERFARDMIEGCVALKRIRDAGGRFLCVPPLGVVDHPLERRQEGSRRRSRWELVPGVCGQT